MKFSYEQKPAVRIKVEMLGDIQTYANHFLVIYNNVKNDRSLLKMYNDYDNGVYLICEEDVKENAIEFLQQFGKIVRVETIETVRPICGYYELPEDRDLEFLDVEE